MDSKSGGIRIEPTGSPQRPIYPSSSMKPDRSQYVIPLQEVKTNQVLLMSLLFAFSPMSQPTEITFADIQNRVTSRNEITNAILVIDNRQKFSLAINDDEAKVTIWKHMKIKDPKTENYTFPVTAEIQQERKRLDLQQELETLISKCSLAERQFRVATHKRYKVSFNMPYEDAIKVLGNDFEKSGPRALVGSCGLFSKEYIIEFRSFRLYDIQDR